MQLFYDPTGFPFLKLSNLRLAISLFPVTKVQFEQFLAEPNEYSNAWYEKILQVNPRISWRKFSNNKRENLFISGIYPDEALDYVKWLGEEFDLPTAQEWQDVAILLMKTPINGNDIQHLVQHPDFHPVSQILIKKLLSWIRPQFWGQLGLWKDGLAEWVRSGKGFKISGCPRQEFYPNIWNISTPPRELLVKSRIKFVGFRPVRRLLKDREEDE